MHTLFDVTKNIPVLINIPPASQHDVNVMDDLIYENDSYYVFDRGYVNLTRLYKLHKVGAFFLIRAMKNLNFRRLYSKKCDRSKGIKCDQIIKLCGYYQSKYYAEKLRRIKFFDAETQKTFVFLTNNFNLPATEIALMYKYRWQVELFFKWIKQHLKVKKF